MKGKVITLNRILGSPRLRATIGLFAALVLAQPALATHGGVHPTFRTESVYFHCNGPTKLQNVNWFVSGPTPWNTTRPSQSVQAGAGCGALEPGAYRNNSAAPDQSYDPVFRGTFVGNLRSMTISVHNLLLSRARTEGTFPVRVRLLIDGEELLTNAGRSVSVTPVLSSTGASELFEFSITNLGFANEVVDANGNVVDVKTGGHAKENGDGTTERTILVVIDSLVANQASAWVWDTTEVPSGITFNPPTLAAAKVAADLPTA